MDATDTDRITQLEQRVAALEQAIAVPARAATHSNEAGEGDKETDGAVTFSGDISLGQHTYRYEWIRPIGFLMEQTWDEQIERLAALAHPVRADIMRRLLARSATVAELVDDGIVTSTGTAYHHINALHAAGWVTKTATGYDVPPARVIPLLVAILAGEAH